MMGSDTMAFIALDVPQGCICHPRRRGEVKTGGIHPRDSHGSVGSRVDRAIRLRIQAVDKANRCTPTHFSNSDGGRR